MKKPARIIRDELRAIEMIRAGHAAEKRLLAMRDELDALIAVVCREPRRRRLHSLGGGLHKRGKDIR